ncbi:crystallin J1A isoform X1 [Salmo salar]|uniref:Crystallin J1A isoform X1 n=1 Tax=Salmo salar TaxID=8030 RepID=A0A1S3M114_SALSA|nr:crystallin J1A isoform X1 [Salmo salar]|eukprot:XP_013996888.1 PREDICTED: crystallin J1A isoform X1 [Salmo salar]
MAMSLADRALGAIIGSAVADAAAQPLHWVYDLDKLDGFLNEAPTPEFRPKSANPFYHRDTGNQSCYGDQAFVLLESLSECGGLNVNDLRKRTYNFFGPRSEYDTPVNDPYRDRSGPRPQLPIEGPWRHGSIKSFMKNMDAGKEETGCETDFQPDGIAKLAPIVALYAGKPDMLEKVEEAVRVTQNNDACVAETLAAARILEHFILNGPDEKVLDSVLDQLTDPNRKQPQDLDKAVVGHIYQVRENLSKAHQDLIPSVFPNSCGLPGSFQAALHGVLTAKEFDQAIRDTMVCGGCTCSRSSFIGACLGAQIGLQGIPNSWKTKTLRYNSLLEHGKKVTERYHQM